MTERPPEPRLPQVPQASTACGMSGRLRLAYSRRSRTSGSASASHDSNVRLLLRNT